MSCCTEAFLDDSYLSLNLRDMLVSCSHVEGDADVGKLKFERGKFAIHEQRRDLEATRLIDSPNVPDSEQDALCLPVRKVFSSGKLYMVADGAEEWHLIDKKNVT